MPFPSVPIHNALRRSSRKLIACNLLLSSVGVMSVFQERFIHCSRPSPWPGRSIPTQTDPSGAVAREDIPASPAPDLSPGNSYEVDEPSFHRTSAVGFPIQRYPKLSPINVAA